MSTAFLLVLFGSLIFYRACKWPRVSHSGLLANSFFMISYLMMLIPSAVFLEFFGRSIYQNKIVDTSLLWISISLFSLSVGMFFARFVPRIKINITKFRGREVRPSWMVILFISVPFVLLGFYYLVSFNATQILNTMLSGNIVEAYVYRTSATNALTRHGGFLMLPFKVIFPFLFVYSLLAWQRSRKSGYLLLSILSFIFSASYTVLMVQKYYLVQMVLFAGFAYVLDKNIKITFLKFISLLVFLIFSISMLVMLYVGYSKERIISIPLNIVERIFLVNYQTLPSYVSYYFDHPLLYGESFPNILHLLPYTPVYLTKEISYLYSMTETQISSGVVGSTPTNFIAELIINFHYLGGIIGGIILGFLIGYVQKLFICLQVHPKEYHPSIITFYSYIVVISFEVAAGSAFNYLHYLTVFNLNILIVAVLSYIILNLGRLRCSGLLK